MESLEDYLEHYGKTVLFKPIEQKDAFYQHLLFVSDVIQHLTYQPDGPALVEVTQNKPLVCHELQGTVVVGRNASCGICLDDGHISREHVIITPSGEEMVLEDMGSCNGTRVNGNLVESRVLADGDLVELGESTLLYLAGKKGGIESGEW